MRLVSLEPAPSNLQRLLFLAQTKATAGLMVIVASALFMRPRMAAHLNPIIVQTHPQLRQKNKLLDDWQKLIDERTAEEFERYTARLKRNPQATSVATARERLSSCAD